MGSVAKSYMRKGFLIYIRKCANIQPYIRRPSVIYEENLILFFISVILPPPYPLLAAAPPPPFGSLVPSFIFPTDPSLLPFPYPLLPFDSSPLSPFSLPLSPLCSLSPLTSSPYPSISLFSFSS